MKQRWEIITDNLRKSGWRCGCISSTDHEGCQFWVVPQSVRTPDASLCMPMKSSPRFLNWNLRFALALIYLDTPTRFLKTRRRYTGLNGRRTFPAGVLRPFWGPPTIRIKLQRRKRKELTYGPICELDTRKRARRGIAGKPNKSRTLRKWGRYANIPIPSPVIVNDTRTTVQEFNDLWLTGDQLVIGGENTFILDGSAARMKTVRATNTDTFNLFKLYKNSIPRGAFSCKHSFRREL